MQCAAGRDDQAILDLSQVGDDINTVSRSASSLSVRFKAGL